MEELEEGKIRFPFSGFDLFWYIIPGAVLMLSVFLFEFWIRLHYNIPSFHSPVYTALSSTANQIFTENWVFSAIYLLILVSIAYVSGHILASIGAFVIERILVAKGYKYPYEHLLDIKDTSKQKKIHSGPFYRGLFFWFNIYFLLRYINIYYHYDILQIIMKSISYYILFLILLKPIFDFLKYKLPKYWEWLALNKRRKVIVFIHNLLVLIFKSSSVFYNFLSSTFSTFLNTRRSFDQAFIDKYKELFKSEFGFNPEASSNNNYWLVKLFVINSASPLTKEVTIWNSMYRFSRNLSTALFISFFYLFISIITQHALLKDINDPVITFSPLILFVLAIIMLLQFFYLYDNRYSRLVFRCFVFLKLKNNVCKPTAQDCPRNGLS